MGGEKGCLRAATEEMVHPLGVKLLYSFPYAQLDQALADGLALVVRTRSPALARDPDGLGGNPPRRAGVPVAGGTAESRGTRAGQIAAARLG